MQKHILRGSIDQEELSINWRLFSIDRTGIQHQSSQAEASDKLITSIDRAKASTHREAFLTTSIEQTEVLTNRTSWNLNFHKENSRSWNFILFILQMNNLQTYIIIITYPIYTTASTQGPHSCATVKLLYLIRLKSKLGQICVWSTDIYFPM